METGREETDHDQGPRYSTPLQNYKLDLSQQTEGIDTVSISTLIAFHNPLHDYSESEKTINFISSFDNNGCRKCKLLYNMNTYIPITSLVNI